MAIMATGMHLPVNFASERDICFFMDWECIHIGPKGDARPLAGAEGGKNACFCDAGDVIHAQFIKCVLDELAGPHFLVHQFRVPVDGTTPIDDPVLYFPCLAKRFYSINHRWFLVFYLGRKCAGV